jgi:hypothetical protein
MAVGSLKRTGACPDGVGEERRVCSLVARGSMEQVKAVAPILIAAHKVPFVPSFPPCRTRKITEPPV